MILLRVLGSTELQDADGRELTTVLAQPKRLALLVYLAAAPGFHRRDTLLALFWPDLDATRSREALNQSVRFLRKELGGSPTSLIISRGAGEIGVEPGALWCDVVAFRDHFDAKRYGEALDLYRGDLLPGFFSEQAGGFEEWLEGERAHLRAAAARAALEVSAARERERSLTTAVTSARRAVELAGLDERVVRELLTRLDRLGDRAGALHAYEQFARRLADELETEPAAETKAVIEQIRRRAVASRLAVSKDRCVPPVDAEPGSPTSPACSAEVNGLRIIRELGRGGMATVHMALDVKHDRYVALKVIRPELATWVGTDRFLKEIQITARLAHPHVLPLIDSGSQDGLTYLVTPYVAGESLRTRLHRETKLSVDDALRLATEIAEAIDYAHRCGIIHRDIKPENILLADGHAIVADFGIARAVTAANTRDSNTMPSGVVVGSPPYMSPEELRGGPVGVQADIYALGCVLVEMLTGALPSSRSDEGLASILQRETVASRELVTLAVDCTAAEATRRPQTAAEVVRRLELAARGTTSVIGNLRPETPRRTTLAGFTAIVALVLVTGTLMAMARAGLGPLTSVLSTGALKRTDQVMIGPVTVMNADSSFGPMIEFGLRNQIGDSKVIRLLSEASVNRTLPLMRLDSSAKVTPTVALNVAKRVGAKAVLDATLTGVGPDAFIISLRLVSSDSGRQLAAAQASTRKDRIIDAITSLSRQMRTRIGESLRSVNETPALSSVTTSSLDALRAYTAGHQALLRGDYHRAIIGLRSAVALDSTFATAWEGLRVAMSAGMAGRFREQYDVMERAYRYSGRLPVVERDYIEEEYYRSNRFDRAAAIRLHEKHLAAGDTTNIRLTALRYASRRDFATAEALLRVEVSRDSLFENLLSRQALLIVLTDEGKLAAADSLAVQWGPHFPGLPFPGLTYDTRGIAAYRHQMDSLAEAHPDHSRMPRAMLTLIDGRVSTWASGPFAAANMTSPTPALDSVVNRVWPIAVMLRQPGRALRELDSAASKVSLSSIWELERTDWQLATAYAQAGDPHRAEKILADYERQLKDTSRIRYVQPFLHTARGEILLAENRPLDAIKEFRAGDMATDGPVNDCTICLPARLGRAFDKASMRDSAIAMFEVYMATPYLGRLAQDQLLLAQIRERLAQLYEQKGDRAKAVANYEKFIDLWKGADPELQPRVTAARDRLAHLSSPTRP